MRKIFIYTMVKGFFFNFCDFIFFINIFKSFFGRLVIIAYIISEQFSFHRNAPKMSVISIVKKFGEW